MNTKLEQASSRVRTSATSATPLSGPKISLFANKTGFLIPKNKLSGSLVPIFRGGKKGGTDSVNEESTKQVQRKTKWGPDLTQDTSVRKARALAYQTRVDQITQRLGSRTLEGEGSKDSLSTSHVVDHDSSDNQPNDESMASLELERQEAIGEILQLNPSYKPPAGYRPLPKEAKVRIPIKEHPGYNFIDLIFGPAHKQLEKETGAQVKVYGTKADSREKVEVTSAGGNDTGAYEEMYVQVLAETYEKVDAAVALIELLVTPVSVPPASVATTTKTSGDGESVSRDATPGPITPPVVNQGVTQPVVGAEPAHLQGHFQQYPGQWFPGGTSQNPILPPPRPIFAGNSSAFHVNNPHQVSPSPTNLPNIPSPFGPPLGMQAGYGTVPRNSFVNSSPQAPPFVQQPYMSTHFGQIGGPRHPMSSLAPTPPQSNMTPPQFSQSQSTPAGVPQVVRPAMPSLPQSGSSSGWSHLPWNTQTAQGPGTMIAMAPPTVSLQGSHHLASQPMGVSAPMHGHNLVAPPANSVLQSQVRMPPLQHPQSGSTVSSGQPGMPHGGMPSLSPNPVPGSSLNFNPMRPSSSGAPKPLQPNSYDFTFQPHRAQNPASQIVPRPAGQFRPQEFPPPNQMGSPHIQQAIHNPNPPPSIQGFLRPQLSNQMSQPRSPLPLDFVGGPGALPPYRHPTFSNPGVASPTGPQMRPMNFSSAPNSVPFFPPRAGNPMPLQQNNPNVMHRHQNFEAPNNPFFRPGTPASSSSGAHQIYDPFSPTSVTRHPHPHPHPGGNPAKAEKLESDPEYEDLMASVGVK